jgi:ABC-type glycerol-3-phosphate transport system substrate-binding protein
MRKWRDDGFWMKNFSSSMWPGAQRDFGNGRCTFLLAGSWLPTELASTHNPDKGVFDLGCFAFPQVAGGTGDADSIMVGLEGFMICRQGRNPENAVLLLRYLTARGGNGLARKLNYLSTTRGVPSPSALGSFGRAVTTAPDSKFLGDGPAWYAPKFNKFVLGETFPDFFLVRENCLTPEAFVETLERKAQEQYVEHNGTAE